MSLHNIEIFEGLSALDQARLLGLMEKSNFPAGSILFKQGDESDGMYVIQSGKVEIYTQTGGNITNVLALLQDGECFGEMALLTGEPRTASARAFTDLTLFKIGTELFQHKILSEKNTISYTLSRLLCQRLAQTNTALQATKSSQLQIVNALIEHFPALFRKALLSAALMPVPSLDFLIEYYGIPDFASKIASYTLSNPYLVRISDSNDELLIDPSACRIFAQMYIVETESTESDLFIEKAAEYYISKKMLPAAVEMYATNNFWQMACDTATDIEAEMSANSGLRKKIIRCFEKCPEELLIKNFDFFLILLDILLEEDAPSGLNKVESTLGNSKDFFTWHQKTQLYKHAARFCRKMGYVQKSMEYLNLTFSLSPVQNDPLVQMGHTAVIDALREGNQDRAFQLAKQNVESTWKISLAEKTGLWFGKSKIVHLLSLILACLCLFYFHAAEPFEGLDEKSMLFIGLSISAVILWSIEVIPAYLVALLMAMCWVLFGLVDAETALSGFSNPIWLFTVGVLGLSAAISKSGLLYRLSLQILRFFPPSYRGQIAGLSVCGLILSPLIPSAIAKVALTSPLALGISESMGFADQSKGSAGLGFTALIFSGLFIPFFLTASYVNFMVLGMLPGEYISWLEWFWWSMPLMIFFSVCMFGVIILLFSPENLPKNQSKQLLKDQLTTLGSMTRQEIITLSVLTGVITLLILQPLHNIGGVWIVISGFAMLVIFGLLDKNTLKTGIDWAFLLYVGIIFAFADTASRLGVTPWIAGILTDLLKPFTASPYTFLPALAVMVYLASFIVTGSPLVILLILSLLPMANQVGIHPWLIAFVILLSYNPFFFSYQSAIYLTAYYCTDEKAFTHRQGRTVAIYYALITIVGIIISIPFWETIGLIK
ncbi:MAG: anion permease [Proteobacteria bacterium]|nr:anion permease [Pseudomonadota bacterium]